jgi:hypothetical protein
LAELTGEKTLQEIEMAFGQEGLDFVGASYAQGLLREAQANSRK